MKKIVVFFLILLCCGCGPTKREKAKSQVETQAELIEQEACDTETIIDLDEIDPWDKPLTLKISKGDMFYEIIVRSAGPDGLPHTSDDIVALRYKKHTPISQVTGEALRNIVTGGGKKKEKK